MSENFKLIPKRITQTDSIDSDEFSQVDGSNIYIKRNAKSQLKDMELKKLQKLNDDFACYVRLSPPRNNGRKGAKTVSRSKSRRNKEMSFVEFDSTSTLIKSLIREIDSIIKKLNKRAERIYKNYSPSKYSSRLRAESPEIRGLRKRTVGLVKDGEGLLHRLARYGKDSKNKKLYKSWMNNLKTESDLRMVLTDIRAKLKMYLVKIRGLVNQNGRKSSKSRETVKIIPDTYSEYKKKKAQGKFEKVEEQLKNILTKLNDFKEETKKPAKKNLEVFFKPKRRSRRPTFTERSETYKVHKKPVIKPEYRTTDELGYSAIADYPKENREPMGQMVYFERPKEMQYEVEFSSIQKTKLLDRSCLSNFIDDDYDDRSDNENQRESKAKLLVGLVRALNSIAKNANLMVKSEPMDEVLEMLIRQSKDCVDEFKERYPFQNKSDRKLRGAIEQFEKVRRKSKNLLNQSSLFDQESKEPFLQGIWGLINKSTAALINAANDNKSQFDDIIPPEVIKAEFSTPRRSKQANNVSISPSIKVSPRRSTPLSVLGDRRNPNGNGTKYHRRSLKNMRVSFSPNETPIQNGKERRSTVPNIPVGPSNSKMRQENSSPYINPINTPVRDTNIQRRASTRKNSGHSIRETGPLQTRLDQPPEGFSNSNPHKIEKMRIDVLEGEGCITVVKIVEDEICAIGYTSGDLIFYNLADYHCISGHREHNSAISTMEVAELAMRGKNGIQSRSILLTGGSENESSILVWDLETHKPLKRLSGHENLISSIIDMKDSASIATASFDCKVAIWDLSQNFNCIQLLEEPNSPLLCLDYNSDDDILCAGCLDGSVIIWQVFFENGLYHGCAVKNRLSLSGHIIELSRSSSIPNTILVLESDFVVRLYSIETAQLLKTFEAASPFVDFVVVERPHDKPVLFCLDNKSDIHKFEEWNFNGLTEVSHADKGTAAKDRVNVKQFIGYSPKTQVLIRGHKLFLISSNQKGKSLLLQEMIM